MMVVLGSAAEAEKPRELLIESILGRVEEEVVEVGGGAKGGSRRGSRRGSFHVSEQLKVLCAEPLDRV